MITDQSPLCLVATVKLKPGNAEKFQSAAAKVLAPTRGEEGNLTYLFHRSASDPDEFVFYEQWKSEAALESHLKSAHMRAFFGEVGPLFAAAPTLKKYALLS